MTKFNHIAAAASLAIAAALPAQAQSIVQTATVEAQPYELASAAGRTRVIERIERAAQQLCRAENLAERARMKACHVTNVQTMVRQLGDPLLLAQLKGKGAVRTAARD